MGLLVAVARVLPLCAVVLLVLPAVAAAQVSVTLQPNQGPKFTGVTGDGIVLWGTTGTIVRNNVVSGKHQWGIRLLKSGNKVYNNTVADSLEEGIYIYDDHNSQVSNNIAVATKGIHLGGGSGSSNHVGSSKDIFVNAHAGDFHLQSASPVKDAGTTLPEVPNDADGNRRPLGSAYDIGAYEYGGTPKDKCQAGPSPKHLLHKRIRGYPLPSGVRTYAPMGHTPVLRKWWTR